MKAIQNKFCVHYVCIPFFVLFFIFVSSTQTAFSQQGIENMTNSHIKLEPKYPNPGETVKATYVSPSSDLDTAFITWTINGKVVEKSFSAKKISFTAGEAGSVMNVNVTSEDGKGYQSYANSQVRVSDVTVVWEGRTYTPPFYRGRALQSPGSQITLVAIPKVFDKNGKMYSPQDLSYVWTTNRSSVPTLSGKGEHSAILHNQYPLQDLFVNVQVKDPLGEVRVVKNILIPSTNPILLLYEDDSYVGMRYDRTVEKQISLYDRETTLVAEPYYMSAINRTDTNFEYDWSVDGAKYSTPGSLSFSPGEITGQGTTYLSLIIKNTTHWLQNARSDVRINYGVQSQWGGAVNFE